MHTLEWEKVSLVSSTRKMDGRWDMRNWRSARARECCFSAKCQKLENCLFVISPLNFILAERECGKKTASKFAKCQTHFFKWYVFLKCSRTTFKNQPTILKIYARKHLISKWALEPYFSRAHHFWNKWSEYFKRAWFREADKSDHDRSTRPTFSRYFFPTHLRLSYTSPQMTPHSLSVSDMVFIFSDISSVCYWCHIKNVYIQLKNTIRKCQHREQNLFS